jgi:hypothetical protein
LQTHVRQRAESSREEERNPRNTVLGGLGEDLGRLAVQGKTVESSRAGVQVGRGSRPSRGQETRVDDRRESLDSGSLNSDDEGRLGSVGASETKTRSVGRNKETDDHDLTGRGEVRGQGKHMIQVATPMSARELDTYSSNVEQQDTDVNQLDGLGQVLSGVLGFTSSDGDDLGTNVGEGGLREDGPETCIATRSSVSARSCSPS